MNAPSSENPGLNLPPPVTEQAPKPTTIPEATPQAVEQAAVPGQKDPTRSQPAIPTVPLPLPPTPPSHTPPDDAVATAVTPTNAPQVADDGDLIEKEWVNKAKEIVERTRENPYQQSKELNVFKADYMKKRYNKTLKLSE
jgi:hypothetical protein